MNKKRIILNTYITDLLKLRITVDAHSNVQRVKRSDEKVAVSTQPKHSLKKVLKGERHK